MAFCRVVFPLLVLSVISCYASSKVPVFLWGDSVTSSLRSNPLTTYKSAELAAILKHVTTADSQIVVFYEETLSVEDFSLKTNGKTSFPYLHGKIHEAVYLPNVEDALPTLNQSANPLASDMIELTENGLSEEIAPESTDKARFTFISLMDAEEGETRAELLHRHDQFMEKTMKALGDSNAIGVYTAMYPSWTIPVTKSRTRRAVETRTNTLYNLDGLRLATNSIKLTTGNDSRVLSELTSSKSEVINGTSVNAILTFDNTTLSLNFNQKAGYWFFENVSLTIGALTEELHPNDEVFAIIGFSYRCAQYISFSSINETVTYTISFEDLKVQPYFGETNTTTQVFGDSFNCVGFFSAPIWAGLFVVFILLFITFYGIMMMMDIRTMDRFDDPKGKTITINAGE